VTQSFCFRALFVVVIFAAVVCSLATVSAQPSSSLTGRLATVEPSNSRITMVPIGEVNLVEFFVLDDSELVHEEESLTLSQLVILVGRRVTALYQENEGRRIAMRITVEPE
jgi:hypothetical protein